jgi:CDP-diacylglycerol pyrophosphatase
MRRPLLALALLAACAPPPEPDTRPNALYHAMRKCLAGAAPSGGCTLVDRERGFVVIKDDDRAKPLAWLIVPDVEVTGIEDSRALLPPVVEFWRHGWQVGSELLPAPPERRGLAINSRAGRSQDLLHIHVSCVDAAVARALAAAEIGPDWAAEPFLTLAGDAYNVRRVATLDRSPFLLLAELPGARADMAGQSLGVIGAAGGGFYVVTDSTGPGVVAEAEALLDEDCR